MKKTGNFRLVCNDIVIQKFYRWPKGQAFPLYEQYAVGGIKIYNKSIYRTEFQLNEIPYKNMMKDLDGVVGEIESLEKHKIRSKEWHESEKKFTTVFTQYQTKYNDFLEELVYPVGVYYKYEQPITGNGYRVLPFFNLNKFQKEKDSRKLAKFTRLILKIMGASSRYDDFVRKAKLEPIKEKAKKQYLIRKKNVPDITIPKDKDTDYSKSSIYRYIKHIPKRKYHQKRNRKTDIKAASDKVNDPKQISNAWSVVEKASKKNRLNDNENKAWNALKKTGQANLNDGQKTQIILMAKKLKGNK